MYIMSNKDSQLNLLTTCLEDQKANNIIVLNVREQTSITDYMIICSGRSSRHVRAIAENIIPIMKSHDLPVVNVSGMNTSEWIIIDFGDYIVHVMQPETREFFNLEELWHDSITENAKILRS
jgi:ribosome-associated protein